MAEQDATGASPLSGEPEGSPRILDTEVIGGRGRYRDRPLMGDNGEPQIEPPSDGLRTSNEDGGARGPRHDVPPSEMPTAIGGTVPLDPATELMDPPLEPTPSQPFFRRILGRKPRPRGDSDGRIVLPKMPLAVTLGIAGVGLLAVLALVLGMVTRSDVDRHEVLHGEHKAGFMKVDEWIKATDGKVTALDERLTVLDDPTDGKVKTLVDRLAQLRVDNDALADKVNGVDTRIGGVDKKVKRLDEKLSGQGDEIAGLHTGVREANERIAGVESGLDGETAKLKARLDRHAEQLLTTTASASRALQGVDDKKSPITNEEREAIRRKLGAVTEPSTDGAGRKWAVEYIDEKMEEIKANGLPRVCDPMPCPPLEEGGKPGGSLDTSAAADSMAVAE